MADFLDSVHMIGVSHVSVNSVPRFWDFLDEITPKILRNMPGVSDHFLGFPIREDVRCPPGKVWFFAGGHFLGGITVNSEPPEMLAS